MKCAECIYFEVCDDTEGEVCELFKKSILFGKPLGKEWEIKVLEAALEQWGVEKQTTKTFEEMAELQKEFCKWQLGGGSLDAIAEELADLRIMLDQMELAHDVRIQTMRWRQRKLWRLHKRLFEIKEANENGDML